jgi:hypothetical protein
MTENYKVRPGGLMRCCLATIRERMPTCADDPVEGEKLHCDYCGSTSGGMIFRDGAWEWDKPPMDQLR